MSISSKSSIVLKIKSYVLKEDKAVRSIWGLNERLRWKYMSKSLTRAYLELFYQYNNYNSVYLASVRLYSAFGCI